ncbi:beta-1,4-N-acetylgalactosaminyltransferase bre-4-like isoform X2 [Physella acuta]|uniref:beta-1,4-N-acetylgalactosaminyltransferase bre-4-like isoform X2 n=1 Tax=Physella acuta TaxID=109671 RepID=UPI0027DC0C4D|nr:beta-1,4-N-acetylgalactosaminyltransferase bre-4-like isoform X2 [Physella acuta]
MDKCTKFKLFIVLLVLCVINVFAYRFFSRPDLTLVESSFVTSKPSLRISSSNGSRDHGANHTAATIAVIRLDKDIIPHEIPASPVLETTSTQSEEPKTLPLCPLVPPALNGPLATYTQSLTLEEIAKENPGLKPGGVFRPPDCTARHRVAIVIPYRNREEHLKLLLRNLHPMLARQQLDYGIFVIDQALPGKFNRAMLMNIGFEKAMEKYDYQCAIFHDVDLIPENDRNIYSCPEMPRHMSAAIDKFNYRLPYDAIYGGVSAINKEQFKQINGFSNLFFGWGGEDDDMATRISHSGLKITRYPMDIARYRMIKHSKDNGNEQNPQRFALLKTTSKRMAYDGLNSLKYTTQLVEELPTHLRIQVLINEAEVVDNTKQS